MEKKANMSIGYFTTTSSRNRFMTPSYAYYTTNLIWVVPPGRKKTSLEKLARPFQLAVWLFFLTTLGLSFLLVQVIKRYSQNIREFVFGRGNTSPSLNIVNLALGGSLDKLPSRNFARTILAFFMIFCFLIQNSYKGGLFEFMQMSLYEPEAKSVDEMIAKNFHFYMLSSSREFFTELPKVLNRGTFMTPTSFYEKFDEVTNPEFKGAFMSSLDHVTYKNIISSPKKFYRHAPEVISTYSIVIYMHKQTCLAKVINQEVINLANGGIIRHWATKFTDSKYSIDKSRSTIEALNIGQLLGAFQLLSIGLFITMLIFAYENVVHSRHMSRLYLMREN